MNVAFVPLSPWTVQIRDLVEAVAEDMADLDQREIFGLRPSWHDAEDVVCDIGGLMRQRLIIDGFVALRPDGADMRPVAVAFAWRSQMPCTAEIAMFGRKNEARAIAAVYRELLTRGADFGPRHGIRIAQIPILADHAVARKRALWSGGREVFDYPQVGTDGQSYIHTVWRF